MAILIPVKYGEINYPDHIEPNICEIAGNFDVESISPNTPYSLHTEYSYGEREFSSNILRHLDNITSANKNSIPQLWRDIEWAKEFFEFIDWLIGSNEQQPEVLEIHPPFNDYCKSFVDFLDIFKVFYKKFNDRYPETTVVVENRCGTKYKGGKFLLSTYSDVLEFCKVLSKESISLKIVLDYPQLFSALYISSNSKKKKELRQKGILVDDEILEKIISFNHKLENYKNVIGGLHMWGKRKTENGKWVPHRGNFDTFFGNGRELEKIDGEEKSKVLTKKQIFLKSVSSTFNDNIPRYFVPEVNSGEDDLQSIVADMENVGFEFIPKKHRVMGDR